MAVPEDVVKRLKATSIAGRMAMATTCLTDVLQRVVDDCGPFARLLDLLWTFVESGKLDVWLGDFHEEVGDLLDALEGTRADLPDDSPYAALPRFVMEMIAAINDIGEDNLFTAVQGHSPITLEPALKVLELALANGFAIPPVETFARSSFKEFHGWGDPVPRSFFGAGPRPFSQEDLDRFRAERKRRLAEWTPEPPRPPQPMADLEAQLSDSDANARRDAVHQLCRKGRAAARLFLRALEDPDADVRVAAVHALADVKGKRAADALLPLLETETDRLVLRNTISALDGIDARSAVPALIELARHPDPFVRHDVAYVLGRLGDRRAIPTLEALLGDRAKPEDVDSDGISVGGSIYRVCDHAEESLRKLRSWWRRLFRRW